MIMQCKYCGNEFVRRSGHQVYCCNECRKADYYKSPHKKPKPKVTIRQVTKFQQRYKDETGIWLGYPEASEMLEKRSIGSE